MMKKGTDVLRTRELMIALFVWAGFSSAAVADGDIEAGKAASVPCSACHGQDGATGLDGTYPNLAGQNQKYMLRTLQEIRDGGRNIPLMAGQLNGKSDDDLNDLAAYYASLPSKVGQAQGDDDTIALAEKLYRHGDVPRGVPSCTSCHAPGGNGNGPAGFPQIGGQPVEYTIAQLTAYREGQRATDEPYGGMMRDIARGLTDTEIAALADYILGLN